jgi:Holliday junction resolvasome RuvABC ATP-dependent DNA helicase subunit
MPEHFILSAKGGMGKTMLVKIFASKMGINFIEVPADQLKEDKDFFELMEKINDKTILFFEECQCLDKKILANHIYRLMEDNTYLRYNQIIELPEICIIGATTDIEKFEPSFSSRFKAKIEIDDYTHEEMGKIIESRAIIEMKKSEQIKIGIEIAKRSFGIPRLAIGHLKSIEEIAILEDEYLSMNLVNSYFEEIGLDENGLNKKHLGVIKFFKRNENKPMSIKRLSIAMGFNRQKVFESEIELPMSSLGLIDSTSRGRCLTEIGLKY